jgi:uridine phosphorylase
VLNELDALVNVDLEARTLRDRRKQLTLVRIGTTGALHGPIEPGSRIISKIAGGFDGLYHFYRDVEGIGMDDLTAEFMRHTNWKSSLPDPYFTSGSEHLLKLFAQEGLVSGITLSTPGFYAPQLRSIRLPAFDDHLIQKLSSFQFANLQITNFEMESSALYALSALMGHEAVTLCVAVANRITKEFLADYKPAMEALINLVLEKLTGDD